MGLEDNDSNNATDKRKNSIVILKYLILQAKKC